MTQVTERKRELNQSGWGQRHLLHGLPSDCLAMPGKLHITHIVWGLGGEQGGESYMKDEKTLKKLMRQRPTRRWPHIPHVPEKNRKKG